MLILKGRKYVDRVVLTLKLIMLKKDHSVLHNYKVRLKEIHGDIANKKNSTS
jgi:hypothetical protein